MGWSKKGSEQIARLRTMRCNSGNIVAYAKEKLTARTHQETPTVWESVLKKQISRHRHSYCNQAVDQYSMPGSTSALHSWMRNIEQSGFMN